MYNRHSAADKKHSCAGTAFQSGICLSGAGKAAAEAFSAGREYDIMTISEMQEEFLRQQNELCDRIEPVDRFEAGGVKRIAGVDLAYW